MMLLKLAALSSTFSIGAVLFGSFVSVANADASGMAAVIDILCPPSN